MSRVLVPVLVLVALAGCSMGSSKGPVAGFGDNSTASVAAVETRKARQGALGGEPATRVPGQKAEPTVNQKLASLGDKAPPGSYDKAPAGALSDRDYSLTALSPERAVALINEYRKQNGLKPLKLNAQLSNAAKAHSTDLAKWDRISHFGSDGSNPWDRVKRAGYGAKLAAENVGTGQTNIEEVMKGWKESPGHNKNLLLADAEHVGIALVRDDKTEFKTFWTLVLGSPL